MLKLLKSIIGIIGLLGAGVLVYGVAQKNGDIPPRVAEYVARPVSFLETTLKADEACSEPLAYRIGSFDEGFGITREEFLRALSDAETLWEQAAARELFAYREDGTLPVNLLFDERQATTENLKNILEGIQSDEDKYAAVKKEYDGKSATLEKKKSTYERELANYEKSRKELDRRVNAYNERVAKYQQDVEYWNERGGAPEDEYERLRAEKSALEKLSASIEKEEKRLDGLYDDLEDDRRAINKLVKEVNELAALINRLAKQVNRQVVDYNTLSRSRDEFESGLYRSDGLSASIDIYQFYDHDDLVLVLTHELGHALGIEHGSDPDSVMYPMLGDQKLVLSEEDKRALALICGE